jgi:hypothetical protein
MARTLTTPETKPSATQQAITQIRFAMPHHEDGGSMKFDKASVQVWYEVTTYDANENILEVESISELFAAWPANFKLDVKSMYAQLEAHAEVNGLIAGPGTDEPLE